MEKIISSLDIAKYYGHKSTIEWIKDHSIKLHSQGMCPVIFNGMKNRKISTKAFVDFGRWLASCPNCGRVSYVDPAEKIAFCFGCSNNHTGTAINVIFPRNYESIETALLQRPVISDRKEKNILVRVIQEKPSIPGLVRNWKDGESIDKLIKENEAAGLDG